MNKNYYLFIKLIALLSVAAIYGCSAESGPVSLPTPFSGSLTLDTSVLVSNGSPAVGSSTALKTQTTGATITWQNFDPTTGGPSGETTFFLDTLTTPIITPAEGGIRREYTLSARITDGCGREATTDNFHCFDYPTNFNPNLRKLICSGNNNSESGGFPFGQLIDAKYVIEVEDLPDGGFQFLNQNHSSMWIHGSTQCSAPGEGEVVFTFLTQGFAAKGPGPESLNNPLFLPGLIGTRGTEVDTLVQVNALTADLFDIIADVQLCSCNPSAGEDCIDSPSCLLAENVHFIDHGFPEVFDLVEGVIRSEFSDDPLFTEALFPGAFVYFVVLEPEEDVIHIDCDKQTGFFKTLCEEQGPLRLNYRCLIMLNPNNFEVFTLEGMWVLAKDI